MDDKKNRLYKIAAAMAVKTYIATEYHTQEAKHTEPCKPTQVTPPSMQSLWSTCGRQELMQMRQLTYMRAFRSR